MAAPTVAPQLRPALRAAEVNLRHWRRTWKGSAFSAFVSPALFLASIGLGLGTLVDEGPGGGVGVSYAAFVGAGLMAATLFQKAATDCSWPIMVGIKWGRTYHAAIATPVGPRALVDGHLIAVMIGMLVSGAVFAGVMTVFGVADIGHALLGIGPALLAGLAIGPAVIAYVAFIEHDWMIAYLFRFGIVPIFLLSGTFFPTSGLPLWAQGAAWISPLWHAVELCRAVVLGLDPVPPVLVSVAYLLVWTVAGYVLAVRTLTRRLTP